MKVDFLSLTSWTRLSGRYAKDEITLDANKRNILASYVSLFIAAISFLRALAGLSEHIFLLSVLDFALPAFALAAYLLNETRNHKPAKIFLLSFLNLYFLFYSLVVPLESGVYLFFFPSVAMAAVLFESEEHVLRWSFIILSTLFLVLLFGTGGNSFSSLKMDERMSGFPFILNLFSSLALILSAVFLVGGIHERSEARFKRLTREVQLKNVELQKTNEELDRFIYSASHDLKSPVNSIKGLTHLAQRDCTDPKSLSYFERIESQTDRMGVFLLELFEYTRNQRTHLRPERVDLSKLVDEVVENLSYMDGAERIEFKKFIRISGFVKIDRVRLMVILNNLISNAIKYHNYDIENPWVKIIINRVDRTMQVMVADNGLGIKSEYKDKIFEMFFRASDRPIGSGLGLFIVKETVEKMDGKILLSSNPGEGACFRIDLPLVA